MWASATHISTVNGSASPLQASNLPRRHPKLTHTHGEEPVVRPSRSSVKRMKHSESSQMRASHRATVVRRSTRSLRTKNVCVIPGNKPIISRLKRECAIRDLDEIEPRHRRLKREDSFVLVDHGNHFQMVKPMYAKLYYEPVPKGFSSTASFHAFGGGVDDRTLQKKLQAVN